MLLLLSPAKTLDESPMKRKVDTEQPRLLEQSRILVEILKQKSIQELQDLMGISEKLAEQNARRFADFSLPFNDKNAKPAIFSFNGDVYIPIRIDDYSAEDIAFMNRHVRILSGLYGLLRPLDMLYPYRLEMGTRLATSTGNTLYSYWGSKISQLLNEDAAGTDSNIILNLASQEYSKAVDIKHLQPAFITVDFKENHKNSLKTVGIHAKKARGMMTDFIIRNRITRLEDIFSFHEAGYQFSTPHSSDNLFVFIR